MITPGVCAVASAGPGPQTTVFAAGDYQQSIETLNRTVPAAVTSVRITLLARSSGGAATGGGALSRGVFSVTPGEVLSTYFTYSALELCTVSRGSTVLLAAETGGNGIVSPFRIGGRAANGTGTIRYSGGNGDGPNLIGGGAAGLTGNGVGATKGPGFSFTQTSDGATATNANGNSGSGNGLNYGGGTGGGGGSIGGAGIAVFEWGQT